MHETLLKQRSDMVQITRINLKKIIIILGLYYHRPDEIMVAWMVVGKWRVEMSSRYNLEKEATGFMDGFCAGESEKMKQACPQAAGCKVQCGTVCCWGKAERGRLGRSRLHVLFEMGSWSLY